MSLNELFFTGKIYRFFKDISIIKIIFISFLLYSIIFLLLRLNLESLSFLNEVKNLFNIDITNFIFLFTSLFVIIKVIIIKFIDYKYMNCQIINLKEEIKKLIFIKNKIDIQKNTEIEKSIDLFIEIQFKYIIKKIIANKISNLKISMITMPHISTIYDYNYCYYSEYDFITSNDIVLYGKELENDIKVFIKASSGIDENYVDKSNFIKNNEKGIISSDFIKDLFEENKNDNTSNINPDVFKYLKHISLAKFFLYINFIVFFVSTIINFLFINNFFKIYNLFDYSSTLSVISIGLYFFILFYLDSIKNSYSKKTSFKNIDLIHYNNSLVKVLYDKEINRY